ncbi:MAG: undecaprenyl-phosphate glucose phosphotransferase [Bacteroidota bacterium]
MEKYSFNHPYLTFKIFVLIVEGLLFTAACHLAYGFTFGFGATLDESYASLFFIFILTWVALSSITGQYETESIFDSRPMLIRLAYTFLFHFLCIFVFTWILGNYPSIQPFLFYSFGFAIAFIFAFRQVLSMLYKYRRIFFRNYKVVIMGSGSSANALTNFFTEKMTKVYHFFQQPDFDASAEPATDIANKVEEMKNFCLEEEVREIYCTLPPSTSREIIEDMFEFADNHFIQFKLANDFDFFNKKDITVYFYDQTPIITMRKDPLASWMNRMMKRVFDIIFSSFVLLLVFPPLLLIVGTMIKLDSRGPVFFRQLRSGRKGKKFLCYKFRTMRPARPGEEFKQATKNDPRITKIGAFLRKTSLDEFPQFINVFLGHMSVVGPRPHPLKLDEESAPTINKYNFRYYITPGITGYAQIHGYRGETDSPEKMRKRVEYDTWYIENWSLLLDFKIVIATVMNALKGEENAY